MTVSSVCGHLGLPRTAVAKDKYLVEMPKKPLGHLQLYAKEKVKELKKARVLSTFWSKRDVISQGLTSGMTIQFGALQEPSV